METEIKGNWKGYLKRFELPSKKIILLPLKRFSICILVQIILGAFAIIAAGCGASRGAMLLLLIMSSMIIGGLLYATYKEFWTVVLEASKGFWADVLMWIYYAVCSIFITIVPIFVVNYLM